jgi:hypothetical protein
MAKYRILYWHDIPVQVRAVDENGRQGAQLPDRFQEAIDEAAMAAKLVGDDAYTDGFQWSPEEQREGTAQDVAQAVADELIAQYPVIDWRATAARLKAEMGGKDNPA